MTTIFTAKRDDRGTLYAIVLSDQSATPTEFYGGSVTTIDGLKNRVEREYGKEATFVPGSQFQQELQQRQTHTTEMISRLTLAALDYDVLATDAARYTVYGSPMRPMSTVWFRVSDAMCIPANKQSTGYHSYVAVPQPLDKEVIEKYELEFVSRPSNDK